MSLNANFGLTYAMGEALGVTADYFIPDDQFPENGRLIQAMTSDSAFYEQDQVLHEYRNVTSSRTASYVNLDGQGSDFLFGDGVNGEHAYVEITTSSVVTGTWLSRVHVAGDDTPTDCGRLAPCPEPNNVPEPSSYALVAIALLSLGLNQRRQHR